MSRTYDLFLFMGQSNMAGRGIISDQWPETAPEAIKGAGYEYRAVSDPECLHEIQEPFGVYENNLEGIYEPGMKTGSMVTSFVNAYYEKTNVPVIGISASKGGSAIRQWQGKQDLLSDAVRRFHQAEAYLKTHNISVRHRYMLWCQGETDGDLGTSKEEYKLAFKTMFSRMKEQGVECCFLITIGEYNGDRGFDYSSIRQAQLELAEELSEVTLVCDVFHTMRARGLMKDEFHYYQKAYNEAGMLAGISAGDYTNQLL